MIGHDWMTAAVAFEMVADPKTDASFAEEYKEGWSSASKSSV